MMLPDLFLQLLLQLGASMTAPTLNSLATVVKGWLFAGRHTLTGVLVAVEAGGSSTIRPTTGCSPRRAEGDGSHPEQRA